jgi:hypothetical protein
MSDFDIAKTANTRVFLIEGRARPDHTPSYQSCLRMMALSQGFGDIDPVQCPDPHKYGGFIEKAEIKGASERPTTSLEGRWPQNFLSTLLKLARKSCAFDVQLHTGSCQDPSSFNEYDKVVILESANLTNYTTEDLGALSSGDNAVINETGDITAKDAYEIVPLGVTNRTPVLIVDEVVDVVGCDNVSCGECENESDGCQKFYAVTKYASGSPATLPDFAYSLDGGVTWTVHDLDGLTSNDPNAVECLGNYVFVVSNGAGNISYVLKSELDGITDPTFTQVTTGIVAGGEPNDAWSDGAYAFIVGDGGYIYGTDDITSGVTVLDAGVATAENLKCVHGYSSSFVIAGGENGALVYTEDGVAWTESNTPVGVGVTINTVWAKSELEWWVGCSNGNSYYTLDGGTTWTVKAFGGSGSGSVEDIVFPTPSVGYLSHSTAAARGRILRSIDGGNSWKLIPDKSGTMPLNDKINALGFCESDANVIVGVGLADDGTDGFIIVGSAS